MLNQITYILLDAARMGNTIQEAKEMNPTFDSLYRGRSEESLAVVAPYLFLFQHKTEFINWYIDKGWGDAWGVLIKSSFPLDELHKHFRKFLIVGTEDNQQLYFRFYDPRVLRIFLPTCDTAQLREFFGPIEYFIMEDEDKEYSIKCWLQNGILHSQKIRLEDLLSGNIPAPVAAHAVPEVKRTPFAPPPDEYKAPSKKFNPFDEHHAAGENPLGAKPVNAPAEPFQDPEPDEPAPPPKPSKPKWNMFD